MTNKSISDKLLHSIWLESLLFWLALFLVIPAIPSNTDPIEWSPLAALLFAGSSFVRWHGGRATALPSATNVVVFFLFSYALIEVSNILLATQP